MTDDLVARLRHTTERMGRECSVPNFDLWNDHSNACLEAADRLEAAEARVRELEAERDKWDRRVAYDELKAREHVNRATQQRQIDALTVRAEKAERTLAEAYERAAEVADRPVIGFSDGAVEAARYIAAAIRQLAQEVKHEAE